LDNEMAPGAKIWAFLWHSCFISINMCCLILDAIFSCWSEVILPTIRDSCSRAKQSVQSGVSWEICKMFHSVCPQNISLIMPHYRDCPCFILVSTGTSLGLNECLMWCC
jgi:hypothetical protein